MDEPAIRDEPELRNDRGDRLRENSTADRFFYVLATIVAAGAAVTFQLGRHDGLELWMVIPGAVVSFIASVLIWWTNAFRYRP